MIYIMHIKNATSGSSIFNNTFIAVHGKSPIGYVALAHHIIKEQVMATTIYYGIALEYRHQGLGSQLVKELSNYLLSRDDIDTVITNIDINNTYSQKVARNAGFIHMIDFSDDEELQFRKTSKKI